MIATTSLPRSLSMTSQGRPATAGVVEVVVGNFLELMIHSVEGLRDRLARIASR